MTKNDQIENIHIQRGIIIYVIYYKLRDRRGRDRMVVGFTTTCETSAYHH